MCGIAGFLHHPLRSVGGEATAVIEQMLSSLASRGPDDSSSWYESSAGAMFGHRRLSILDLSVAGRQPMVSKSGRFVVTFNGEIYNFQNLRQELESAGADGWRGHSDTEIALAAFERWGICGALQ